MRIFNIFTVLIISLAISGCSNSEDDKTPPILNLAENIIDISADGADALEVKLETNNNFQVVIEVGAQPWVSLVTNLNKDLKSKSFFIKILKNEAIEKRTAKIQIRVQGENGEFKTEELTINQEGHEIGIFTAEDLIEFSLELNKPTQERDKTILSKFGKYNKEKKKWIFEQKKDINLNPNLTFRIDLSDPNDPKIIREGEISNKWIPIGSTDEYDRNKISFEDEYDGGNFKIINLYIEGDSPYSAFFGYAENAQFRNIHFEGGANIATSDLKYNSYSASLLAYASNLSIENVTSSMIITSQSSYIGGILGKAIDCNINNSKYSSSHLILKHKGDSYTTTANCGGIVGRGENVIISNCETMNVNISLVGGNIGGIAGYGNNINISNCQSNLNVRTKENASELYFGGIAGDTDRCIIILSNSYGLVELDGNRYFSSYGGIVGGVTELSAIAGCENNLLFKASSSVSGNLGGILGNVTSSQASETFTNLIIGSSNHANIKSLGAENLITGGIVGYGKETSIVGCYNISQLDTHDRLRGSIAGFNSPETIKGTYWLANTASRAIALCGEQIGASWARSRAEMKGLTFVNDLNTAINNWNTDNIEKVYKLEFYVVADDYPKVRGK